MTHCPECNRKVASNADICPSCRYDFAPKRRQEAFARLVASMIFAALCLLAVFVLLLPGIVINGFRGRYKNRQENFILAAVKDWQTWLIATPISGAVIAILWAAGMIHAPVESDETRRKISTVETGMEGSADSKTNFTLVPVREHSPGADEPSGLPDHTTRSATNSSQLGKAQVDLSKNKVSFSPPQTVATTTAPNNPPMAVVAPSFNEIDAMREFERGKLLFKGDGVPKDMDEAVRCFMRAANKGYASAQHQLGVAYAKGWGVPQSDQEAVGWYIKAAVQGLAEAQHDLAVRYVLGQGVDKNVAEGVRWYRKAASQGWEDSIVALRRYDSKPPVPNSTAVVIGVVEGDQLNVRSAPAMSSSTSFKLSTGQTVQIRGDSVFNGDTEWIPITFGMQQGWVTRKFLKQQ